MEQLKLISLPTSPYAARVQIQAYEKGIDLPVEFPAAGVGIRQHASPNPLGKIPVLMVGQERLIESAAIQEYLEDIYPFPSLRGADPLATARMRAFIRAVDLYLFPLIFALRGLEPGSKDLPPLLQSLFQVIDQLQALFEGGQYVCGQQLTLADCALVPACFYLERLLARHRQASLFERSAVFNAWWDAVSRHQSVSRVIAQLEAALVQRL